MSSSLGGIRRGGQEDVSARLEGVKGLLAQGQSAQAEWIPSLTASAAGRRCASSRRTPATLSTAASRSTRWRIPTTSATSQATSASSKPHRCCAPASPCTRASRRPTPIVGTRLDLQESLDFVAQGKVGATVATDKLENINDVLARLHEGRIEGRVVLDLAT